jgi:glucose/mannose-6-phosphate isomerase
MSALDNLEMIRKIDKSNMLQFCTYAAKHYVEATKNSEKVKFNYSTPGNIIVSGMGGSGIGGELLKDYIRNKASVPVEVNKHYSLPAYSNKKTLVLLVSYSGDTEETLSAFLDALNRKCMIYCVSSGGNLLKFAEKLSVPFLQVKGGIPPRAAMPHLFVPLLKCIEKMGLASKVSENILETTKLLERISRENKPENPSKNNFAKTLAFSLNGTIPVVYGFGVYRSVAMRWKQQLNENSKIPAKWEIFSELNHNEIVGWENPKQLGKNFSTVFIRDKAEPIGIRSRIENTETLMQPTISKIFEVWTKGKHNLSKMLSTVLLGDFVSVYLALLRKVDPTPVNSIVLLKEKIEKNRIKENTLRELEKLAAN